MENQEKQNNKDNSFSEDKGNVEIIEHNGDSQNKFTDENESVHLGSDGIDVKKGGNIVIGSLNIMAEPIKKRHDKHYKDSKFHLVADLVLVLIIITLFFSFLFIRNLKPSVDINLESSLVENSASSGDVETFIIKYANNDKNNIKETSLAISLPKDFVFVSASPRNIFDDNTNTFEIGDLSTGANGQVEIKGIPFGNLESQQVLSYSFNYKKGNLSRNKLGSLVFPVKDSVLSVDLVLPKEVYKDVTFNSKLLIKNNGKNNLDKEIEVVIDGALDIKSLSEGKSNLNNNAITISEIKAGESIELNLESVTNLSEGSLPLSLKTYIKLEDKKILQTEKEKSISVQVPKFTTIINTDKKVTKNGEAVKFTLHYANEEKQKIEKVNFDIRLDNTAFNIKNLKLKGEYNKDKIKVIGNTISIDNLNENEKGSFDIEIVLDRRKVDINQQVSLLALINYKRGQNKLEHKAYSPKIKLISSFDVKSKGLYYSLQGDQLGIGPLPPVVNVPTRYWVFWEIDNYGNELKDVSISAELPSNIVWTDQKSLLAGKLRYAEISKRVVWTLDDVSQEGGKYKAGFAVELVPNSDDKGKVIDLIKNVEYSAYDSFAEEKIKGNLENINTNLKYDNLSAGKGVVVELDLVQ